MRRSFVYAASALFLLVPVVASAHEVYVLSAQDIATDIVAPPFDMLSVAKENLMSVFFWGFVAALTLFVVFWFSTIRRFERETAGFLRRLRPYAPDIARITLGVALLAGAFYQATYGPELPMAPAFGAFVPLVQLLFLVMAVCIIFGFYVRAMALIGLLFFAYATYRNGVYMLTYTNYLGELLVLLILGMHKSTKRYHHMLSFLQQRLEPYAFVILRACFGVSLLYAALYAKIWHNLLALQVAADPLADHLFGVAYYLHFEPHFLVLGAAIIEILLALLFIFGLEIRFTALFLEFWLTLSLFYFGEVVWPHLILIGIPIAFMCYGYDQYSLEGRFFKKRSLEPVL